MVVNQGGEASPPKGAANGFTPDQDAS